ncbi:hypothetical protein K2P47_01445 [Patescibacteria group bacterium]|nr:hypothetical protein [Patescibacteria group bacterium]
MTADARSLGVTVPEQFDFDSQAGILFVLRAIRAADLSGADKNSLKDLVFLYNTGGKDESVKKKLADTLSVHGVTPATVLLEVPKQAAVPREEAKPLTTPGFMGGRLTPVFHPPVVATPAAPIPVTAPAPVSVVQVPQVDVPVIQIKPETQPNVVVPKVEKVTPVAPVAPPVRPIVPVPQPVTPVPNVTPEAVNIEVKKDIPTPVQTPVEVAPAYVASRMERIRVIKSDVNARVGNPVNLVDVDNALGREYMSALLEAMKLLSSASEQESTIAMNRLETVYAQVLLLLDAQQKTESAVVSPVTPPAPVMPVVPVTPVPPVLPVVPVVPVAQPAAQTPMPEVVAPVSIPVVSSPVVPSPVVVPQPVLPSIVEPALDVIVRSKVSDKPTTPPVVSNWETAAHAPVDMVSSVGATVTPPDVVMVNRMSTPPAEPLRPVVSPVAQVYQPEVTPSVGEVQPLRAITELPTADEVSAVEAMSSNPLYTKDIDAGLDQLLSEWAIFKKSGLFGTGPKGREHPLYIKISPMQVPLILSGRFEGSTQEIKQSITDYMNGWRYEQGIVYEPNETFDQYLRRVIRHILDLQKTKRRS